MDVYVKQILGSSNHDLFYTNAQVIVSQNASYGVHPLNVGQTAFKNYIKTFVGRYANEPTIMAWELGKCFP